MILLYGVSAVIFLLRMINSGGTMISLVDLLKSSNTEVIVQQIGGFVIGPLYLLVMLGGPVGSIYYASRRSKDAEPKE